MPAPDHSHAPLLYVWGPSEEETSWPAWEPANLALVPYPVPSPGPWPDTWATRGPHVGHMPHFPWCSAWLCPDNLASIGAQMKSPASSGPQLPTRWGEMALWPQGSAPTRMMWPLPMRGSCRSYQVSRELELGQTS